MNTRIYNVRILTMEDGKDIFQGEVWIQDDTITYVGPGRQDQKEWDQEIDGEGSLLMPGFKNAHTHSAMTFLRSHADDLKLDEWLFNKVFPAEGKLTGESLYWFTKLAFMEYLTSGITTAYDMYFYVDDGARAAKDAGFRYVFCDSINNFGGTVDQVEKDFLRLNIDRFRLISHRIGFHAEYTTSRELMEGIAALAERHQAPVSVHCSETRKEVEECRERYGCSPVALMDSLGLFRYGGTLFHCVHMDETDYDILKKRGIYVVTNPASNLKLASGIAPIKRYLDLDIPVAIGTDGAASNNCLDMFREMFLVTGLQKAVCDDPEAVPAREVLKMATVNGARACGLPECDSIAEGKKADLILIDLNQPNMQPLRNLDKNLVYSGSKSNVKMTMIGGKVLYRDGEFYLDSSREEIFAKANEYAEKIFADL
ncbi:amidohydrolase [Schaedlerella arabinosiphila]|uniref:amidohydrolase n=1 Tax=Schaedlerella arabinosiphila TaxID=2044587 RepID=UPI002557E8BE|nr:amidohydrolase [Schaedlerella arabinosiphila]